MDGRRFRFAWPAAIPPGEDHLLAPVCLEQPQPDLVDRGKGRYGVPQPGDGYVVLAIYPLGPEEGVLATSSSGFKPLPRSSV
jgi:hypothetical protein